jgi:hypothetical protein
MEITLNKHQKKTRKWMVAEKARVHNKLKNIMPTRCHARRQARSERKFWAYHLKLSGSIINYMRNNSGIFRN